ncbi:MAG: adenylate/guanylate cyclase domain-containing protein [Thermodesulfobacteriota bacterium]
MGLFLHKIITALLSKALEFFPEHLPIVYKISLLITGLILFCSTTLSGFLFYDQTRIMEGQINEFGNTMVNHLARSVQEPLLAEDKLAIGVLVSSLMTSQSVIGTEILSPEGNSIVEAGLSPFSKDTSSFMFNQLEVIKTADQEQSWPWQLAVSENLQVNVVSFVSPIVFKDVTAGYALVSFSQENLDKAKKKAIISIAIATLVIIILGIRMSFSVGKRISRPVDHLMEAIEAFDQGNYDFRFKDRRHDEVGQLMSAFDRMAAGMVQKKQVEKALDRYLSPQVAREVITNLDAVKLGGKRVAGSVLFADIVGFTQMSESMAPEDLAAMLNHYFSLITQACELNLGTVDKYMGDCVMLLFGAPVEDTEHAFHAALCSLLIRRLVDHENKQRTAKGLFPVNFRIGINAGSMLAGNMGSKNKMEYTVVGDTVNLASRFCSMAEIDQIVVSNNFFEQKTIRQRLIADKHIPMKLRGFEGMVETYLLESIEAEYMDTLDRQFRSIIGLLPDKF